MLIQLLAAKPSKSIIIIVLQRFGRQVLLEIETSRARVSSVVSRRNNLAECSLGKFFTHEYKYKYKFGLTERGLQIVQGR